MSLYRKKIIYETFILIRLIFKYTLCHLVHFPKIWCLFCIWPFLTLLHWKSNNVLYHKVNSPCFIFSLDYLNKWKRPSLSLWRFKIPGSPSLFLMGWLVVSSLRYEIFQGVIRSLKSEKVKQYNGQKKKHKQRSTKHYTVKTKDRATRTPLKPGVDSRRGSRRVTLGYKLSVYAKQSSKTPF
jgi:hypothetical protein